MKCILFVSMLFCSSLLCAMQVPLLHANNKNMVWNIVLTHGVEWFDARMIKKLAQVHKDYDSMLCQTAEGRKHYFIEHDDYIKDVKENLRSEDIVWHKYGAAYGKIAIEKHPDRPLSSLGAGENLAYIEEELMIKRRCLHVTHLPDYITWQGAYGDFCGLPHQPRAFFNEKGDFCWYLLHKNVQVMEFSLSANGDYKEIVCQGKIKGKNGYEFFGLQELVEFPILLKALLDSSMYQYYKRRFWIFEKDKHELQVHRSKVFDFEGVIIPENYQECVSYGSDIIGCQFFDHLPQRIGEPIVALYKKQQKKKEKKEWLRCFAQ